MKFLSYSFFLAILGAFPAQSQSIDDIPTDGISKVIVANIRGDVTVRGTSGSENLQLEIVNQSDRGVVPESVKYTVRNDSLIIYIEHPCANLYFSQQKPDHGWSFGIYKWENNCQIEQAAIDLMVRIPRSLNIEARTINDGHIHLSDIDGIAKAYNINGDVGISNCPVPAVARTINGRVSVDFPGELLHDSDVYSLNGDLDLHIPKMSSAVLSFKSIYGDLFTDSDNMVALPARLEKKKSSNKTSIKLAARSRFQMGDGGHTLSIETFNGDAFVRTQSKNQ